MCDDSAVASKEPTGAPANEFEITAKMLKAGDAALLDVADSDARVCLITSMELAAVYRAMRRLEPASRRQVVRAS
jgi:hypothetical protein